jgi:hypothetical protein
VRYNFFPINSINSQNPTTFSKQTGEPCESFHPWPPVNSTGGGAVIPCKYEISAQEMNNQHVVVSRIKNAIEKMQEKSVLVIKIT